MKSKVKASTVHGYNVDALKSSSFDFLENERQRTLVERGHVVGKLENGSASPIKETSKNCDKLQQSSKMPEHVQLKKGEEIVLSNERVIPGVYAPKRYVTKCYFEPHQIPVWYSETMILNIGSTKKKYFESIYYENKLSPFHWTESVTTRIPDSEEPILIHSDVNIPIEKPEFHYISLEPQQIAAVN